MANPNFIPEFSSNSIWWKLDQGECLSDIVDQKAEASHDHPAMIQAIGAETTMTNNYGTFTGTLSSEGFVNGGTYLVSVAYINSNALVDRTLYAVKINTETTMQTSILLVSGHDYNDSLYVMYQNNTLTFSSTFTGSATTATVKIV